MNNQNFSNDQEKKKFMLDFPDGSNEIDELSEEEAMDWALENPGTKLFEITKSQGGVCVDLN